MKPQEIIAGFPAGMFLTLVGVTLLFAQAQTNGTLDKLAARAVKLARGNTGLIPLIFFVLALFPSLLRKLPKSGTWLNSVKVVMGFLELAAAFKFLRLGELLLSSNGANFFTYELVLGLWVAIAFLCALYLLNFYRLANDTPLESLGVPRVLLAGAFLCLGFYMLPALFKVNSGEQQRPAGAVYAWIDAFLLPDQESVFETTRNYLEQTRAALKRNELWRAESLARKARQLATSLSCPG